MEARQVAVPLSPVGPLAVPATNRLAAYGHNNGHVHHWLIEATDTRQGNETLDAVCKLCGATRTYPKAGPGPDGDPWARHRRPAVARG